MKKDLLTLNLALFTFLLATLPVQGQSGSGIYIVNIEKKVKERVENHISKWLVRDEFEKTEDYMERLGEKEKQIRIFTEEAIDYYMQKHIDNIDFSKFYVDRYDADSESFKLWIDRIGDLILHVPIDKARIFKENRNYLTFSDPQFVIRDNTWVLSHLDVETQGTSYSYDIKDEVGYNPKDFFEVTTDDLSIDIPEVSDVTAKGDAYTYRRKEYEDLDEGLDIHTEFPETPMYNPESIAIVIGNRSYSKTKDVHYAVNDARAVKEYLIQVLGFKPGNVVLVEDATKGDFENLFGNEKSHQGKLYNMVREGISDVFIFYSGHGAPGLQDKKGYFVPVECEPNSVHLAGYPLDLFYNNVSKVPGRSKTIVIDACFSGVNIYEDISPIIIRASVKAVQDERTMVFSSSDSDQVSTWYNAKRHGLFTFFFLKALHDPKAADKDENRKVSYQELYDFISDNNFGVPYYARRLHSITQTPVMQGANTDGVLLAY